MKRNGSLMVGRAALACAVAVMTLGLGADGRAETDARLVPAPTVLGRRIR